MYCLYIILLVSGMGSNFITRHPMPDLDTCLKALKEVKIAVSQGNESEGGYAAFCGKMEAERYYNGTWWQDAVKKLR